ncbi:MAG: cysteine desulfurase-like protein [Woeseiaceae bacterium]|nr:cysteine desulfurase-like protein [Woeseiaceae bacterium]
MTFDLETIRAQFPALSITDGDLPRIYFDNPGGTQVSQRVVDAMQDCLIWTNANVHGDFQTSRQVDELIAGAHAAVADLLNAPSADEIVFGQNMTTLTFQVSRSIGRCLQPGDEIVLSRMDHDANVAPWLLLARDHDLEVRWLPFDPESFEFDLAKLDTVLSERTRLVCVAGASNLTGTINDIKAICKRARAVSAWSYIDAVQSVPHVSTDVQDLGCDFLVCSAYKFFGPHIGTLWGRRELLEMLDPYKVRPARDSIPDCFETGTQNHEGMAGLVAAVDYFAWIGETMAQDYHERYPDFSGRRKYVHAAMDCLFGYERKITRRLIDGLLEIPGVRIHGISDAVALDRRVPTVAFTSDKLDAKTIGRELGAQNIFVWTGHYYAVEAAKALGIYDSGGAVRVGLVHYNTQAEVDRLLNALDHLLTRSNVA